MRTRQFINSLHSFIRKQTNSKSVAKTRPNRGQNLGPNVGQNLAHSIRHKMGTKIGIKIGTKLGIKVGTKLGHKAYSLECGSFLIEAMVGITIIMVVLSSFFTFIAQSFTWAQKFHIQNELFYENITARQVLRYALMNTGSDITVNYNSRYLIWDGKRRYGIEYGEVRRMLDNGQKQALTSPSISPYKGNLVVTSIEGRPHFTQLYTEGPIHMEWQMELRPASALDPSVSPEITCLTMYPMHKYFTN